jgi:nucleoid DNA-binding protein
VLTKNELAAAVEARLPYEINSREIKLMFDALADVAEEEIARGEDFSIPGVARISWSYTSPRAKGDLYKKGEQYVGFGGQELVAEADSKERKAAVKLRASITNRAIKGTVPSLKNKSGQSRFLRTAAGKRIVERKQKG